MNNTTTAVPAVRTGLHGGPTVKSIRTVNLQSSFLGVEVEMSWLAFFGSPTPG